MDDRALIRAVVDHCHNTWQAYPLTKSDWKLLQVATSDNILFGSLLIGKEQGRLIILCVYNIGFYVSELVSY